MTMEESEGALSIWMTSGSRLLSHSPRDMVVAVGTEIFIILIVVSDIVAGMADVDAVVDIL